MSQFIPPGLPPQPETSYTPQFPIPPAPQPHRPRSRPVVVIVAIVALLAGSLAVYGFSSHSSGIAPIATPDTQASVSAANATANAIENAQLTQQAITNATDAAGYTPVPQPTTPPNPHGDIGIPLSSGPWNITINSIKPTVSDNQFEVPKAGNQFILINFTALNTDVSAHDMNPFYFTLRDGSGTSYDYTALTVATNPDGTVVSGQKLRGDLAYEIPKSLHSVTLQFDSPEDFDHSQVVQWNLTI